MASRRLRSGEKAARLAAGAALAAAGAAAIGLGRSTGWLAAFGAGAAGDRRERILRSPQFDGRRFRNPVPTHTIRRHDVLETLRLQLAAGPERYPACAIPVVPRSAADFAAPPASDLRLTWLGHASALVEIDGRRLLTDPVWSERVSPSSAVGPRRFFAPPLPLEDLPELDAVLVSHDHYDHLDMATVRALARRSAAFVVPLGVGAHLERWGIASQRIRELDWSETVRFGDVAVTATPARHFSGRGLTDRDRTLWSSFAIAGPRHRVFYSGDSGDFDGFRRIGREHGPFDAALMSVGAYGPTWPDVHMVPEDLVRAHTELQADLFLPVHWATFNLAFHAWNEPAERASAEARVRGVRIAIPRPGESLEPSVDAGPGGEWWRTL
ncbi:MAG TPA: MBL fold metallo-hydrolase [Thermoanaerobaculia bacterium]|nr:MBL fold metallo-hydrolase [Thermoanaerobaculia bacterium]